MSDKHVTFIANGVPVTFPFQPYDIQRQYIESVIKAAQTKQNALLESPTGTGKTLSLLCSSLAWQQSQSGTNKMIYYTSRTHIQLSQAAKEMKRTAYARVPSVVLASRTHMCMNDEVKQQSHGQDQSINRACKNAIAKNACAYFNGYEQKMERLEFEKVHDIEDLYAFGKSHQCCPYYASKKVADSKASLVFMPYNYLLDLSVRKSNQIKLEGSIVIFDEGHNIESALKDSASAHFKQNYLKIIQDSCLKLPEKLNQALLVDKGISRTGYDPEKRRVNQVVDEFSTKGKEKKSIKEKEPKINPIEELSTKLTNDKLNLVNRCAESLLGCQRLLRSEQGQLRDTKRRVEEILEVMKEAGVEYNTSDLIIETLESMATFWSIATVMNPTVVARYLTAITNLTHFISLLYPPECKSVVRFNEHMRKLNEFYVVHISGEFEKTSIFAPSNNNKLIGWEVNLWCLQAAVGLKRVFESSCLNGPRSLIITSGTLAPMRPIEDELGVKFSIVREFKHLITKEQLKVTILGESPDRCSLLSTYDETKKPQYSNAIGETLLILFKVLPFGTLVFFPSYSLMNKVTKYWEQRPQLWRDMSRATKIFKESKEQLEFNSNMSSFKKLIDGGQRCVFMGVCRGKLSEGTNLDGNHCRSVIIVGLPFPSMTDPRVQETKDFHSKRGDPRGDAWYTQQMRRALSQAFGRVIRNRNDFGMLYLCDPRFTKYKFSLSEWIRPFYPTDICQDIKKVPYEVKDFFLQHSIEINESDISEANNPQGGAFELDYSKTKSRTTTATSSIATNNGGKSSFVYQEFTRERTLKDRQAEMVASYTVSKDTFNKIKATRPPAPIEEIDLTQPKKPKSTTEIFDIIFDDDDVELSQPTQQDNIVGPTTTNGHQPRQQPFVAAARPPTQKERLDQPPQPAAAVAAKPPPPPARVKVPAAVQDNNQKPAKLKQSNDCYVCKNPPKRPHIINCSCARVGCWTCIKGLNNKTCGECNTLLKTKKFKPKMFNVFQKREV